MGMKRTGFSLGLLLAALVLVAVPAKLLAGPPPEGGHPALKEPRAAAAIAAAEQLGDAFVAVAEAVSPAVVNIRVQAQAAAPSGAQGPGMFFFGRPFAVPFGPQQQGGQPPPVQGAGSGIILREDGYILTNHHVVKDAVRMDVRLKDGRVFEAQLVGKDPATDLAVIRVEAQGLPALELADSDGVRPGQWAVAIGSPFGLDYTVTTGVVSAVGRGGLGANEIEDYIQTDASINPGNSGGPLVNLRGQVVGINTMIIGRGTGIGFAVPSSLAKRVSAQIMEGGQVRRPWIGVAFQELTPELAGALGNGTGAGPKPAPSQGALVSEVVPDGPAQKAGVQPGDVVVRVDGAQVGEGRDLLREILKKSVGQRVRLRVWRNGRYRTSTMEAVERPQDVRGGTSGAPSRPGADSMGLQLEPLSEEQARRLGMEGATGVLVRRVEAGSVAARAGLEPGHVIVGVDHRPARSVAQVRQALAGGSALLRVQTRNGFRYVVLRP